MRRHSAWGKVRASAAVAARSPRRLWSLVITVGLLAGAATAAAPVAAGQAPPTTRPLGQVVPAPASVRPEGAPYAIGPLATISVPLGSAQAAGVGRYLASILRPSTGYALPVLPGPGLPGGIALRLGKDDGLGAEGYRLDVRRTGAVITADTAAGLFHGVQTLRQQLPGTVESATRQSGPWTVAGGTITDTPRYAYRGAMLDVSRHFFTVAQVERYIDQLALYKINYLHLHLSDDQGWRIAIKSWPNLAPYGGSTEVGGGTGGYYTEAQYEQIIHYAASRFMTVVPEIDMPAHTNAALASYAELNCDGVAPPLYTGTDVGFSSLCVNKDVTYTFVEDVIRELAALTPGPYLHIGGDEAHSTTAADYKTFMDRVQPLVGKYGKSVMAWNEIANADPVPGAIAQYWGTAGNETSVINAAKAGTRLVMSPANHAYLDMKYDASTKLGLHWAGYVEVKDSYNWDPATFLKGAPASAVYGVEAPIWSETLTVSPDIEFMAFPRLPAIAELGWSPAASHDWDAFSARLAQQGPRWDAMGLNYYHSPQVPWPTA